MVERVDIGVADDGSAMVVGRLTALIAKTRA